MTSLLKLSIIIVLLGYYNNVVIASTSYPSSISSASYLNTKSSRNEEPSESYSRGFWNSSLRKTRSSSRKSSSQSIGSMNKDTNLKYDLRPQEESIMTIAVDEKSNRNSKKNNLFLLLDCTLEILSNDPDHNEEGERMTTLLDTGAQATFLSVSAARRAGILHLMDTRYAGHAKGVGGIPTQVLGRIPANTLKLSFQGGLFQVSPSILILSSPYDNEDENKIDLLLGMDLLLEWKAQICLQKMQLIIVPPNSLSGNSNMNIRIPFINTQEQTIPMNNDKPAFISHSKSKMTQQSQTDSDLESDLDWLDNYNRPEHKSKSQDKNFYAPINHDDEYDSPVLHCNNIEDDRMNTDNNEQNSLQDDDDESDDWDDGDDEELFDLSGI